jgi:tetratricopeptide (TPR) repeat protein
MTALEQARTHFEAGEFAKAREAAIHGLESSPEDVELLRVAGKAGVETGAPEAVEQLQKVAELQPDAAEAWLDLGDALAAEGRSDEADEAFRKVLEIDPEDETALTAIGHAAFQAGRRDDAVSLLEQVAGRAGGGASTAHISLVDMYKSIGQLDEALSAARRVADADPGNALAELDVAELSLNLGRVDDSAEAFERLRQILEFPEDEVSALHGAIKAELRRDGGERALELAREAAAIDVVGGSPAVLAHLEAELGANLSATEGLARGQSVAFIQAQEAPPSRAEVDSVIDTSLSDLRRKLVEEDRRVADDLG